MPMRGRIAGCLLLVALPLAISVAWAMREPPRDFITIATWNLEWLVAPGTTLAGRTACRNARRSALPCDVVRDLSRDSADLARLARYARELDADIIAFQEVENVEIAQQVFRGYRICIAGGPGVQHVGFAIRPHVVHHCGPELQSLSLDGRSRVGMRLQLHTSRIATIELLAVHLKSGCSRDPLDAGPAACTLLAEQARHLGAWIAERDAEKTPFIVLGDFNRGFAGHEDDIFWQQLGPQSFTAVAEQLPFRNCWLGQPYSTYIDHILLGPALLPRLIPDSARHSGFRSADVARYRLSDHCPVSISLKV